MVIFLYQVKCVLSPFFQTLFHGLEGLCNICSKFVDIQQHTMSAAILYLVHIDRDFVATPINLHFEYASIIYLCASVGLFAGKTALAQRAMAV